MSQEQINILLAALTVLSPIINNIIVRALSKKKDVAEYSTEILEIANKATESLKRAREDLTVSETEYEKTIDLMRKEHGASLETLRLELNARINRQKARIEELEKVTKIYTITFDLVTHPNLEIRNPKVKAMDDTSASQKMKAITDKDLRKEEKN